MKQKIHDYFAAHEQEIRQGMLACWPRWCGSAPSTSSRRSWPSTPT